MEDACRLHVNDIYRYLFRLTRDARQAEDLTQQTFFRAFSSLDDYRGEKVRPWLFKVAYHAFVDWHRKQMRRPLRLVEELPEHVDIQAADPADSLVQKERWESAQLFLVLVDKKQLKIAERYAYLQEKGVRIYGAVLTGPTKELLKLREEPSITGAFLGKVDWWNWDPPAASGTQYNW